MIGFPTNTITESRIAGPRAAPRCPISICTPRSMKKNKSKKSRRPTRRAASTALYGVAASATPATKAPTSLLNPNPVPSEASPIAQPIANRVNSSGRRANECNSDGSRKRVAIAISARKPTPLPITSNVCLPKCGSCVSPP